MMNLRMTAVAGVTALALSVAAAAGQTGSTSKPASQTPAKPSTAKPAATKPSTARPAGAKPAPKPAAPSAALRSPSKLTEKAPEVFNVAFDTTAGPFLVQVNRSWAPNGADRFYNLVKHGYYDNNRFFRVVPGFVVQFGINGDPKTQSFWEDANIKSDPVTQSNRRGTLVFAMAGHPDTRTTQLFINYRDNTRLDQMGFAPFGQVVSGMEAVDKINAMYGEEPDQGLINSQGNAYLNKEFPKLDYIRKATLQKPAATAKPATAKPAAAKPAAPVKK